MRMRKWYLGLALCFLPLMGWAETVKPVLNQVIFQTSAEKWVTTKTAEVTVSVDATLNEEALAKAHTDILEKLGKLVRTDWHITQFNRTPNQSGLEQLSVLAETRLPETALSDLRTKSKNLSKPGETYTIQSIVFSPTLAETEAARSDLRAQIYSQVQRELSLVNKTYGNQHYVVHEINFIENIVPQQPVPQMMKMAMVQSAENGNASMPVTVANKMVLNAMIKLVSINQ